MEDPEKLFKKKDKEKIDISLFGASSFQNFHSIFDRKWEINVEKGLLKSKYESDLKNIEFNAQRLEYYLLDSLWRDLQKFAKVEEAPFVQNIQNPLVPPIPPIPMVARFAPLCLPVVLHDLPQNCSQRISLFDGEEGITAKQHVAKFEDFVDLEEVYYAIVCSNLIRGSKEMV